MKPIYPMHAGKTLVSALLHAALLLVAVATAAAQTPTWKLYKPGNTGIGGSQLETFTIDSQNHKWVGSRHPFWQDGGVAMFDDFKWVNYSNIDTPMPTEYVISIAIA